MVARIKEHCTGRDATQFESHCLHSSAQFFGDQINYLDSFHLPSEHTAKSRVLWEDLFTFFVKIVMLQRLGWFEWDRAMGNWRKKKEIHS